MERSAREEATAKNELKELLSEIHSERERLAVAMEQCTRRIDEAARAQDDSKEAEQRERSARVESERQWEEERGDLVEHLRVARDESAQMGRARETKDGELKRVNVALETRERDLAAARDDLRVAQKELANKEQELDEHYTVDMANAESRHRTEVTTKDHRVRELEAALAERDGDTTRWEHKYVQLSEQTERIRTEQRAEIRRLGDRNDELENKSQSLQHTMASSSTKSDVLMLENQKLRALSARAERKCLAATQKLDRLLEAEQRGVKVKAELQ